MHITQAVIFFFHWWDTALHLNTEVPKLSVHHSHSVYFLTYDLSIRAEYGCVLSDRGARWHQTDSLSRCLGFDLRHNDVGSREIFGLTPTLSCMWKDKAMSWPEHAALFNQG